MGEGCGAGVPAPAIQESERAKPYDASGAGASPYSFFDEPEPVTAADVHFRGLISKEDLARIWVMRRVLNPLSPVEQMEVVLERLEKSKSNAEFLASMQT